MPQRRFPHESQCRRMFNKTKRDLQPQAHTVFNLADWMADWMASWHLRYHVSKKLVPLSLMWGRLKSIWLQQFPKVEQILRMSSLGRVSAIFWQCLVTSCLGPICSLLLSLSVGSAIAQASRGVYTASSYQAQFDGDIAARPSNFLL